MDKEHLSLTILKYGQPKHIGEYSRSTIKTYKISIIIANAVTHIDEDTGQEYKVITINLDMVRNRYSYTYEGIWWINGTLYFLKLPPKQLDDLPVIFDKIHKVPYNVYEELLRIQSIERIKDEYTMQEAQMLSKRGIYVDNIL